MKQGPCSAECVGTLGCGIPRCEAHFPVQLSCLWGWCDGIQPLEPSPGPDCVLLRLRDIQCTLVPKAKDTQDISEHLSKI